MNDAVKTGSSLHNCTLTGHSESAAFPGGYMLGRVSPRTVGASQRAFGGGGGTPRRPRRPRPRLPRHRVSCAVPRFSHAPERPRPGRSAPEHGRSFCTSRWLVAERVLCILSRRFVEGDVSRAHRPRRRSPRYRVSRAALSFGAAGGHPRRGARRQPGLGWQCCTPSCLPL